MDAKRDKPQIDFSTLTLSAGEFPDFHRALMQLRFPLPVAQVLELRYLINHAVDDYREPPLTADHRQFREALLKAIDSYHIENRHHRRRLLKLLALLRELHVAHSLASRDGELALREKLRLNREARVRAQRDGMLWLLATAGLVLASLYYPVADLPLKVSSIVCALLSLRALRSRPRLDAQHESVRRELNDLLRVRVTSLYWKTLIHKLSLVLGYKQVRGIEVFRPDSERLDRPRGRRH
jgi:hypothetical protein